jgi:hypothetical protein
MKSLLVNVFWPAWEWGPINMPYLRHLAFSYAQDLTTRDNNKLVNLVCSPQYLALWGERFTMVKTGETRPENNQTGFVLATSVTGVGTGERGDRSITGTSAPMAARCGSPTKSVRGSPQASRSLPPQLFATENL